ALLHVAERGQLDRNREVVFLEGEPSKEAAEVMRLSDLKFPLPMSVEAERGLFEHSGLLGPDGQPLGQQDPGGRRILAEVVHVTAELWRALEADPALLQGLDWRTFEHVVAELLAREGYEVKVAPKGADGGVD